MVVSAFLEEELSEGTLTPQVIYQIIGGIGLIRQGFKDMDEATVVEYC